MASYAVLLSQISRVVGYNLTAGNFATTSPNLPHSICVLAEANDANQSALPTTPVLITSRQQGAALYGYGSPIDHILRILLPSDGGGVAGIPVTVMAQAAAVGGVAAARSLTFTGSVTAGGTMTLTIAGRQNAGGQFYDINVAIGDSLITIYQRIADVVNNVLGAPVIGAYVAAVTSPSVVAAHTDFTAKWSGITSEELTVTITGASALGLTAVVTSSATGSGTPSVSAALAQFGNVWYTDIVNGYGTVSSVMTTLEAFNGRAVNATTTSPTGRYVGITFKPFIAHTGSTADNVASTTDTHLNDQTIAICPAPLSRGFSFEAAANYCRLFAVLAQEDPELDIAGSALPDMPVPADGNIGSMADYNTRNTYLGKGSSTVTLQDGQYIVQDFVTTYHPTGENPAQYRYCRILNIDFNSEFTYMLEVVSKIMGKPITSDNTIVANDNVVKPKDVKALIYTMTDNLCKRALWTDADFTKGTVSVSIGTGNPDRFDISYSYKRSGCVRVVSCTVRAGFNFGTIN